MINEDEELREEVRLPPDHGIQDAARVRMQWHGTGNELAWWEAGPPVRELSICEPFRSKRRFYVRICTYV